MLETVIKDAVDLRWIILHIMTILQTSKLMSVTIFMIFLTISRIINLYILYTSKYMQHVLENLLRGLYFWQNYLLDSHMLRNHFYQFLILII